MVLLLGGFLEQLVQSEFVTVEADLRSEIDPHALGQICKVRKLEIGIRSPVNGDDELQSATDEFVDSEILAFFEQLE